MSTSIRRAVLIMVIIMTKMLFYWLITANADAGFSREKIFCNCQSKVRRDLRILTLLEKPLDQGKTILHQQSAKWIPSVLVTITFPHIHLGFFESPFQSLQFVACIPTLATNKPHTDLPIVDCIENDSHRLAHDAERQPKYNVAHTKSELNILTKAEAFENIQRRTDNLWEKPNSLT